MRILVQWNWSIGWIGILEFLEVIVVTCVNRNVSSISDSLESVYMIIVISVILEIELLIWVPRKSLPALYSIFCEIPVKSKSSNSYKNDSISYHHIVLRNNSKFLQVKLTNSFIPHS